MDFHNSFQLEGRGYRAEARTEAHPPNRKWDRSGEGEAKDQAEVRVQDGLAHPALAWGKVMMPFFLIFLLVCAVEDGIKVALFFHRVSLQHLTVVLVNFSLQVLVICLKTSWSPSFEPSCPNGPKRVANFEAFKFKLSFSVCIRDDDCPQNHKVLNPFQVWTAVMMHNNWDKSMSFLPKMPWKYVHSWKKWEPNNCKRQKLF